MRLRAVHTEAKGAAQLLRRTRGRSGSTRHSQKLPSDARTMLSGQPGRRSISASMVPACAAAGDRQRPRGQQQQQQQEMMRGGLVPGGRHLPASTDAQQCGTSAAQTQLPCPPPCAGSPWAPAASGVAPAWSRSPPRTQSSRPQRELRRLRTTAPLPARGWRRWRGRGPAAARWRRLVECGGDAGAV